jgi:soluble lytic murein transglycosylase-like protein
MNYKKLVVGGLWVCGLLLVNQSEKDSQEVSNNSVVKAEQVVSMQKNNDGYTQPPIEYKPSLLATCAPKKSNNIKSSKLYSNIPLSARFQLWIDKKCVEKGISTNVVMGVIKKESNFRIKAMGDNGEAYGLMQIQKKWHGARMNKVGAKDLLNCYDNVHVGIDYLAELYKANNKDWHKTLMAYNGGQAYANRRTSTYYSRKVLEYAEKYKKERN